MLSFDIDLSFKADDYLYLDANNRLHNNTNISNILYIFVDTSAILINEINIKYTHF